MGKPKINISPVASYYDNANERTLEFTGGNGGGLLAVVDGPENTFVDVYRQDQGVKVRVSGHRVIPTGELTDAEEVLRDVLGYLAGVLDGTGIEAIQERVAEMVPEDIRRRLAPRTPPGGEE